MPLDHFDRYGYRFCRCLRVGLGYLPIPESLLGKVVQGWIGVVESVRGCSNVDLGDDFWKLFVTLLIGEVRIHVLDLLDVFWLLPPV